MIEDNGFSKNDLEDSLEKAQKVCRMIRVMFRVATLVFIVTWGAVIAMAAMGQSTFDITGFVSTVYMLVYGMCILFILLKLTQLFTNVVENRSPFSEDQADCLRSIALIGVALVVFELAYTAGFNYVAIPEFGFGMVTNDGIAESTVNLNIGMLIFSAIMYSLSAIFRYAALLQQLSDGTV